MMNLVEKYFEAIHSLNILVGEQNYHFMYLFKEICEKIGVERLTSSIDLITSVGNDEVVSIKKFGADLFIVNMEGISRFRKNGGSDPEEDLVSMSSVLRTECI